MATDDIQVLVAGQAPVPAGFLVPGNGQIRPKAMNAVFDGTSAATAFLPTLEIVSDAGIVVARCPASSVAAGASAEVSWFPRLAAGAAAPSGPSSLSYAYIDASNLAPASGVSPAALNLPLAGFHTNDATTFAYNAFAGVHGIQTLRVGTYLVIAAGWFDSGGAVAGQFAQMDLTSGGDFLNEISIAPFESFGGGDWEASTLFVNLSPCTDPNDLSQSVLLLQACENSTAGANLDAGLQVIFVSTATD